ncbi:inactive serine/threonine-protein kinase 19-like [Littorina saxatilis]|uniref:Serine/threonine-protein kinase 19 n=1 Tax=Littorina saxatilis TaxID=31220 RepID=A0AAN9BUE4_9CAEN
MSRKRSHIPELYKAKRRCVPSSSSSQENGVSTSHEDTNGITDTASDARTALLFLRGLFPVEKFEYRLPPIVLKHQLYSVMKNRTLVDKQLNDLRTNKEVKVFKLGPEETSRSIVFTDDYRKHVLKVMTDLKIESPVIEKVRQYILDQCTDVSLDRDTLYKGYGFTDMEITYMIKASILTVRDVGSWWLSIPNAGIFMKSFNRGRKSVTTMIRKSKYKEILKQDLEQRQWPKVARLGISYHIHDIMGADLVECIDTNSGQLLRLRE